MANHVFTNQTITHSDPAELTKLYEIIDSSDNAKLVSYLVDEEYTDEDLDRNIMSDASGAKWISVEEVEHTDDTIILMTTTAWSYPHEMWENLEQKGFSIDANYEDEMPNFFGQYSTENGDQYIETEDMYEAIDETAENFESDIKETSDYNNAMYEECVDAAIKAIEDPVDLFEYEKISDFNRETVERLVENYLEFQDLYIGE